MADFRALLARRVVLLLAVEARRLAGPAALPPPVAALALLAPALPALAAALPADFAAEPACFAAVAADLTAEPAARRAWPALLEADRAFRVAAAFLAAADRCAFVCAISPPDDRSCAKRLLALEQLSDRGGHLRRMTGSTAGPLPAPPA
ncbi:MAG: hypothetical protein JOZ25_08990 [Actinobacteria bacterium]|nr:hypothetical protein [Actinomycetota bacterium]